MPTDPNDTGQRLRTWLARAALEARESARASPEQVAAPTGGIDKIRRFEAGTSMPHNVDQVIASYAKLAGVKDPRDIYQRALQLWYEHGEAPQLDSREATRPRFEEEIAPQARPRDGSAPSRTTTSKRKKKAI